MPDHESNQASSIFRTMRELMEGIEAARIFGMRDLTVTTIHRPRSTSPAGDYIAERVEYHLDAAMLDPGSEEQRQLEHVNEARRRLSDAQRERWFAEQDSLDEEADVRATS